MNLNRICLGLEHEVVNENKEIACIPSFIRIMKHTFAPGTVLQQDAQSGTSMTDLGAGLFFLLRNDRN